MKKGWFALCRAMSDWRHCMHDQPFRAASTSGDAMTQAFLTLQNSFYGLSEANQVTLVGCCWEAKKDQTVNIIEGSITNYASNLMELIVGFQRYLASK